MTFPSQDQRFNVRQFSIASGATQQVDYDFRPEQITVVIHQALVTDGLYLRVAGEQGGAEIPFLTQGPFIVPGISDNQHIELRNADTISHTATVIAQRGYPPTSIAAPTVTIAGTSGSGVYQTLTDGANIAWPWNLGSAEVTLAGNRTLDNPTGANAGDRRFLIVKQDATGGRTLAFGSSYRFEGGSSPSLSSSPGQIDLLEFNTDGTLFYCVKIARNVGATFSPTSIAGLQVWLDASRLVALNNGDPVASFTDFSGNARHFEQATPANRPVYQTNILNSLPVVRFDGVSDFLDQSSYTPAQPLTVLLVVVPRGGLGAQRNILDRRTAVANAPVFIYTAANVYSWLSDQTTGTTVSDGLAAVGVAHAFSMSLVNPAQLWLDGVSQGTVAGAPGSWSSGLRLGAGPAPSAWFNGDIAELIIYNTVLGDVDRQAVEQYLIGKWAI